MKSIWFTICAITAIASVCLAEAQPDEPSDTKISAADLMIGREPGQTRDDNALKMKLVWCPPGKFKMGSPEAEIERRDDEDQVEVTLTKGFWLGKYEVTQDEYERIMGKNPSWFSAQGNGTQKVSGQKTGRFPVEQVTWDEAVEFCRKLTDQERSAGRLATGWEYTLPTEAEWEYACRAATTTAFSFGSQLNGIEANCAGTYPYGTNSKGPDLDRTTTVGSYSGNKWGLCDMHGNVWEWCRDWHVEKLPGGTDPELSPRGPPPLARGWTRVFRGGSWCHAARKCRSAYRLRDSPGCTYDDLGFRLALGRSSR